MAQEESMINDVREIVEEVLGEENLNLDEDLISSGKINSILVVEIIEKLESYFNKDLDEMHLTNETFRTIRNIANLIQ